MARTPEGAVKAQVIKQLKELGVYYFSPVTGGYGASGCFDIVCCVNGVFVGIECKATCKHAPTALQSRNAAIAKSAGGVVLLIHADNTHIVGEIIFRLNLLDKIKNGSPIRPNRTCVWPFDGVEEDTFKYPE